jgi:hypothetical protein
MILPIIYGHGRGLLENVITAWTVIKSRHVPTDAMKQESQMDNMLDVNPIAYD